MSAQGTPTNLAISHVIFSAQSSPWRPQLTVNTGLNSHRPRPEYSQALGPPPRGSKLAIDHPETSITG